MSRRSRSLPVTSGQFNSILRDCCRFEFIVRVKKTLMHKFSKIYPFKTRKLRHWFLSTLLDAMLFSFKILLFHILMDAFARLWVYFAAGLIYASWATVWGHWTRCFGCALRGSYTCHFHKEIFWIQNRCIPYTAYAVALMSACVLRGITIHFWQSWNMLIWKFSDVLNFCYQ